MTTRALAASILPLLLAAGCLPQMEDNSIGSPALDGSDGESLVEQGELAVSAGGAEGDWTLAIGEVSLGYHSPSRVDLSGLAGPATLALGEAASPEDATVVITDDTGVAFVSSVYADEDGSTAFGRPLWSLGEAIGRGELVDAYDESNRIRYREVLLAADDGELVLLPGEPVTATIDGVAYRVVVSAAFETVDEGNAKCDTPDTLAIELVRGEADESAVVEREAQARVPSGVCG